jgi:hypothetical protein
LRSNPHPKLKRKKDENCTRRLVGLAPTWHP